MTVPLMASGIDLWESWLASSVRFLPLLDRYDYFEEVEAKTGWIDPTKRSANSDL